jgi:hypothetical protein
VLVTDPKTGKPALEFSGTTSQYLEIPSAPSIVIQGDISTFCALDIADVEAAHTIWSKSTNGVAFPWIYAVATGGDLAFSRGNDNGQAPVDSTTALQPGVPAATGVTVAGSLGSHYFDGAADGTGVFGYGALDVGTPLVIGALDDLTNQFAGTLSELLIYNRALSGSDLAQVNDYLAARSSITVIEPAQPTSSVALTITRLSPGTVQVSWPESASGFVLESETALSGANWTPVATNPPNNTVVLQTTNVTRYFRLQSQ